MKSKKDWLLDTLRGRTFDDFLISPGIGIIESRKCVNLKTRLSQNIELNIPLVSSNMDTVTGARMAISVAKQGGIGIIHRYLSIEEEMQKVKEVKRKEGFIINQPYSISRLSTIADALQKIEKHKVGGLMVVDDDGKLIGILTMRDTRFSDPGSLVEDRMTPRDKLIFTKEGASLAQARKLLDIYRLEKLPVINENFMPVSLITAKDIESLEKYPLANKDSNGQLIVGAAVGATGDFRERSKELIKAGVDVIVIDIANGQSIVMEKAIKSFRKEFPDTELICGNIALPEYIPRLERWGVNGVKIGIGPGRACSTRLHTNIGIPQAYTIYSCYEKAKIPLIADGGIRRDGHLGLALMLGASSIMIGSRFAGTEEAPGLLFEKEGASQKYKKFRGMASREAMYSKFVSEFDDDPYETTMRVNPEGIEIEIPYKGPVAPIITEMIGHLASTISYIGARSLREAKKIFMFRPVHYLHGPLSSASKHESFDR